MKKSKVVQKYYESAGLFGDQRSFHLTNTDKSTPTPEKNHTFDADFTQQSFDLFQNTKKLFNEDKKTLRRMHLYGLQKLKFINNDTLVLYSPANPAGNSNSGWKLAQNLSNTDKARLASKQAAKEKALANVDRWYYFATFTLNRKKQDRYDFHKALEHLTHFLQRRNVSYFLVPERHKDGAWHFHGLLSKDIGPYLSEFDDKAKKNNYIKTHPAVMNCRAYQESFGYCTIEPCRNSEACVYYMMKYVLKTFDDANFERASRRRYFTSKGLKSPKIINPLKIDLNDFTVRTLSKFTPKVYLKRFNVFDSNNIYNLNPPPL